MVYQFTTTKYKWLE